MRSFLLALVPAMAFGCGQSCPSTTQLYLARSGSSHALLDGKALPDTDDSVVLGLNDDYTLGGGETEVGTYADIPDANGHVNEIMFTATATPTVAFDALVTKPLTELDGTELHAGQGFTSPGTFRITRWDLPYDANGNPSTEEAPTTFAFRIDAFAAPSMPSDLSADNWSTPAFMRISFTATATTSLGTFEVQGSDSYGAEKSTYQSCPVSPQDECHSLFGCD